MQGTLNPINIQYNPIHSTKIFFFFFYKAIRLWSFKGANKPYLILSTREKSNIMVFLTQILEDFSSILGRHTRPSELHSVLL